MGTRSIGIDAGGSLIKMAFEENRVLHFKKYPIAQMEEAMEWLKIFSADRKIILTGGKAGILKTNHFPAARIADEFTASCEGASFLLEQKNLLPQKKFLLVNVGTGTSWFTIDGDKQERILGSGVGGGTFMGLGKLLGGNKEFTDLVELSGKGTRGNVDLLVKDIYHPDQPPIPGELTASNFAKTANEATAADRIAAVSNLIAETLTLLTVQAAALQQTSSAVFIGSTIAGNNPLQESLKTYLGMSGIEPVFLPDGEFSGAIGAKMF
ncbi:type II pantothenate kinase [Bacillus sp. REN3]|uniref:type II pantothenate kinase n=1 Tax=Bacillus sp. REN3 TaxID=2802440 RepID=UPI001AEE570C|nr:type II pantothenate kinase [Bacillus sp. REN3]